MSSSQVDLGIWKWIIVLDFVRENGYHYVFAGCHTQTAPRIFVSLFAIPQEKRQCCTVELRVFLGMCLPGYAAHRLVRNHAREAAEMTALSLLYVFAAVVFLALAGLVLRNNVRSRLNWSCALFLLAFALWSFEDVFHGNPSLSANLVNRFSDIGNVGRCAAPSLFLWFVLLLTRKPGLSRPSGSRPRPARALAAALMVGLPLLLLVMLWTRQVPWQNHHYSFGWVVVWNNGFWAFGYYAYCAGFLLLGMALLYRFLRRTTLIWERRRATVILVTTLVALALGAISDVVFPNVLHLAFPELAGAFTLIWAGGLYYSVARYGMTRITPKAAADEIIATMRDSLLLLTPEGRIVSANQAARDLLEYAEAELVGKPAATLFASPGRYEAALQQVRRDGELKYLELTCRTRQGKEVPASVTARMMREGRNAGTGIVWVLHDISGRQEHEAALRRAYSELEGKVRERTLELTRTNQALQNSEERFRILFEYAPDAYYLNDMQGRLLDGNRAAEEMVGYRRDELIGQSFLKKGILTISQVPRAAALLARNALGQATGPEEFTLDRKDGSRVQVEIMSHPVTLDGKRVSLGTMRDITRRRQAEAALRASEERFRTLVETTSDWIWEVDENGRYTYASPRVLDVLGYAPKDVVGKTPFDLMPEDEAIRVGAAFQKIAAAQKAFAFLENRNLHRDGREVILETSGTPIFDDTGAYRGFRGLDRNITERKRAEAAVEARSKELARSNAELQNFAHVASHDLQEPLRMVVSFTQLLARRYQGKLDERADKFIAYAVDGAVQMQNLINDLLSYSRLETRGREPAPTDCQEVLRLAKENLRLAIKETGAEVSAAALPVVSADSAQLVRLFQNLIANAIKFHGQARPRVHVSAVRRNGDWLFAVQDNGIGIDPEQFERIFQIFQRLHTRSEYPGTGIGLALCKRIVERHGGRIWVESRPGQGSTFNFTLPRKEQTDGRPAQ